MRDEIIARQNDPRVLEQMYPINKSASKRDLFLCIPNYQAGQLPTSDMNG